MSRCRYVGAVVAICLLTTAGGAFADTYYVPDDFTTIQEAIVAVNDGDEIGVRPDTYNEAIDFLGKTIRLFSTDGPEVTTIDATDLGSPVVKCTSGEGRDTVLQGFTITGGRFHHGGGLQIIGSSPTVTMCVFIGNTAGNGGGVSATGQSTPAIIECRFEDNVAEHEDVSLGGGMYIAQAQATVIGCAFLRNRADVGAGIAVFGISGDTAATVSGCSFEGNTAASDGGGLDSIEANLVLRDCAFTDNSAGSIGGGVLVYHSHTARPELSACRFVRNQAWRGGGMAVQDAAPVIVNCLFDSNEADITGGGLHTGEDGHPTVINSTFLHNTAPIGGGVYNYENPGAFIRNSILWDNGADQIGGELTTVSYSDVQGGYPGMDNIDEDPLCDFQGRSRAGSPCIDAGDNTVVPEGVATDLEGYPRFANDPCMADTGNPDGVHHPVDMGAYEFQPPCPADLDCSSEIEFGDVLSILSAWNCAGPCLQDLDESGVVDFGDVLVVLREWGQPCLCEVCTPVDDCDEAPLGGDGFYAFSTRNATTDGPTLPPGCDEGNGLLFRNDVWMKYGALCDGTVTASVCDADFDTRMAVYEYSEEECPGTFLACSDDACGENGARSEVSFPVESGGTYLIRIGARFAVGEGTLVIECAE